MVPWFLRNTERLERERIGVEELTRSAAWLVGTVWCIDGGLCLDAIIRAHNHDYDVRVSFPSLYPDAPVTVRPLNMDHRISSHQYGGADGPLCLEWGPDNWHRDVTAVKMLESTHRLFEIENPLGEDRPDVPVVAPNRHRQSLGQTLRGEWARWYASNELIKFYSNQTTQTVGSFKFSFRKTGENWITLIHEANLLDGANAWKDPQIPSTLPGATDDHLYVGIWFKTDLAREDIGKPKTLTELETLLADLGTGNLLATDGSSPVMGFEKVITGALVIDREGGMHLFVIFSGENLYKCSIVHSGEAVDIRRSPDREKLSGKQIGIVGLGSVGSKIAMSLSRMGVEKFYLVDHDVLLPENFQRHALDWLDVVQHKVDAVKSAISRVSPKVIVEVCRLDIAGQESNAAVSGALYHLAECDLLIDATANPKVFNLLSGLSGIASRPLIWMEVFAGGIGGYVARSRPGSDPTPQVMRGAYLQYCTDNPAPELHSSHDNYEAENEDGEILVASDADVSVIACHAARFVPDCFAPSEYSNFPYSMYLIGLAKGWVFKAPYVTIPISMEFHSMDGWYNEENTNIDPDTINFLLELTKKATK